MKLTTLYHDTTRLMADPLSDPLCQMLAAEDNADEIDALIERELAWSHVKPTRERDDND